MAPVSPLTSPLHDRHVAAGAKLADFGIAVHETDVRFTHVGMVNGTPGYMAPELFATVA